MFLLLVIRFCSEQLLAVDLWLPSQLMHLCLSMMLPCSQFFHECPFPAHIERIFILSFLGIRGLYDDPVCSSIDIVVFFYSGCFYLWNVIGIKVHSIFIRPLTSAFWLISNFIVLYFWLPFKINLIPCIFRPSRFFFNCLSISSDSIFSNSRSYLFVVLGAVFLILYPFPSIFPLFVQNFPLISESLNMILISLVTYLNIILYILIFNSAITI